MQVALECCAEQARITVSDTGEGIEAQFLERIFDRFTQADATITRRHGGLGTTFVVELPLLRAGEAPPAAADAGAQVECVASAREALAALVRFRPHVLLSDIGMPGMDGYEMMRRLRALPAARRPQRRRRGAAVVQTAIWAPLPLRYHRCLQ